MAASGGRRDRCLPLIFDLPGESDPGFGDEHSGEFNASIQSLKSFYDRILQEFQIDQIP